MGFHCVFCFKAPLPRPAFPSARRGLRSFYYTVLGLSRRLTERYQECASARETAASFFRRARWFEFGLIRFVS